jgi:hypothetical protein
VKSGKQQQQHNTGEASSGTKKKYILWLVAYRRHTHIFTPKYSHTRVSLIQSSFGASSGGGLGPVQVILRFSSSTHLWFSPFLSSIFVHTHTHVIGKAESCLTFLFLFETNKNTFFSPTFVHRCPCRVFRDLSHQRHLPRSSRQPRLRLLLARGLKRFTKL